MKQIHKFIIVTALALAAIVTTLQAQVTPTDLRHSLTNSSVTITNGVTTFAGTTNNILSIPQGKGLALNTSILCTNAAQVTFYWTTSVDGTNYGNAYTVWGHTGVANSWLRRSTNIPASVLDNHRYWKLILVSNAADTVVLSNNIVGRP